MHNNFYRLIFSLLIFITVSINAFAFDETGESQQCCGAHSISYCDLSSGHYVCNDGGYSTCICTEQASVSAYQQLNLGCCLWHNGVAANSLGQVVCNDGSLSEVCSLKPRTMFGD